MRLQDLTENMFAETEQAQALREIRARDPAFDMPTFLKVLKNDVPRVIRAYLEGDAAILKEHCSPEMVERLTGIVKAQHAEVGPLSPAYPLPVLVCSSSCLESSRHPFCYVQAFCQERRVGPN
jgi:hypothetical protein